MRAVRITKENIKCLTMVNSGVELDEKHCLDEVHFFIDPEKADGTNELMHEAEFFESYYWAKGEVEIENVFVRVIMNIDELLKRVVPSKSATHGRPYYYKKENS